MHRMLIHYTGVWRDPRRLPKCRKRTSRVARSSYTSGVGGTQVACADIATVVRGAVVESGAEVLAQGFDDQAVVDLVWQTGYGDRAEMGAELSVVDG